jgi:hypothetical protein
MTPRGEALEVRIDYICVSVLTAFPDMLVVTEMKLTSKAPSESYLKTCEHPHMPESQQLYEVSTPAPPVNEKHQVRSMQSGSH